MSAFGYKVITKYTNWGFVDIGKNRMFPRLIFKMCNNNSRLAFIHMQTSSIYILTDDLPEVK